VWCSWKHRNKWLNRILGCDCFVSFHLLQSVLPSPIIINYSPSFLWFIVVHKLLVHYSLISSSWFVPYLLHSTTQDVIQTSHQTNQWSPRHQDSSCSVGLKTCRPSSLHGPLWCRKSLWHHKLSDHSMRRCVSNWQSTWAYFLSHAFRHQLMSCLFVPIDMLVMTATVPA